MKRRMTLGEFLVAYLKKIGVRHVFGIPGDLALKLFFALGRKHDLEFLGSDGNSSSYSVRSLRAGVYFVNGGSQTFKFLISE